MKHLFAIIFCSITVQAFSQIELWKDEVDDFTGRTTKITHRYALAEGVSKLSFSVGRLDDVYFMYVYSNQDLGCSGATGNHIIFLFDDDSTLKIEDSADIDCDAKSSSLFIFEPSELTDKTLRKVRLKKSEYYDDGTVTDKYCEYSISDLVNAVK